jgi:hypothetical protein
MGPEESGTTASNITDGFRGIRDPEQSVSRTNTEAFINLDYLKNQPLAPRVVIRNLVIQQLTPDQLHANWPFIKRGAEDILKKVGEHTSWCPEDLYAALRYPEASHAFLWMITRNLKALGWVCCELQRDRYGQLECFIWNGWDIPLRERTAEDDVAGGRDQVHEFIKMWAKQQGCHRVSCLSPRPLERIGWSKGHTTYYMPL